MGSGLAIYHELRDQCYDDNFSDDIAVTVKLITMLGCNTCSVSLDLQIAVAMIAV
ncbi:hypothetical protein C8R32_102158 [Nitrosospira sp. Nsp5]|uniref:Uncharacterized protein n=1 Tax=Nitrosospira multiformis TaxID=1231 RepID=A0ABY0TQD4_9PROT|nr:hypothetical protein C8R32_102158 [Nitrosospira sp. Nsp5]SDQ98119.1 hypothetical protein SAMN05216402_3100 [Nitrosospira multiformis]